MELNIELVWNIQLKVGEQVVLLHVSQEFLDQEHIELGKQPLVTCVEKEECLPLSRLGADGTEKSTLNKY